MNKLLTIALMFSAMAATIPTQAIVETRAQKRARLAENALVLDEVQNQNEDVQMAVLDLEEAAALIGTAVLANVTTIVTLTAIQYALGNKAAAVVSALVLGVGTYHLLNTLS